MVAVWNKIKEWELPMEVLAHFMHHKIFLLPLERQYTQDSKEIIK